MNPEFIQYMLDALETPNKELTKWEDDFVYSVRGQFKIHRTLSERQVNILEKIYAEKTP